MVITLLGAYIVIVGLMTMTVSRSQVCQNINCKFHVLDFCLPQFRRCMFVAYSRKIMHNIICVTDVYSRGMINMFFVSQVSGLVETLTLGFTQA